MVSRFRGVTHSGLKCVSTESIASLSHRPTNPIYRSGHPIFRLCAIKSIQERRPSSYLNLNRPSSSLTLAEPAPFRDLLLIPTLHLHPSLSPAGKPVHPGKGVKPHHHRKHPERQHPWLSSYIDCHPSEIRLGRPPSCRLSSPPKGSLSVGRPFLFAPLKQALVYTIHQPFLSRP